MDIDFPRRVEKIRLPVTRPLLPVFEAVVNSIQAIWDQGNRGRIDVVVQRDRRQRPIKAEGRPPEPPITGFAIQDDGVGFTAENYDSFFKSDTGKKRLLGGKGVGRFLWLRMFRRVLVESVYAVGAERRRRTFEFVLTADGVENHHDDPVAKDVRVMTRIELRDLVPDAGIAKAMPKTLDGIASRLVEHCVDYFLHPNCPTVFVREDDAAENTDGLNLNELFEAEYGREHQQTAITVGEHVFNVTHLRVYGRDETRHHVRLTASSRPAMDIRMEDVIAVPKHRFRDESNRAFWWSTRVSGPYFDANVDSERGVIDLPTDDDALELGLVTMPALRRALEPVLRAALEPLLKPFQEKSIEEAKRYIEGNAPDLRPLLKYRRSDIAAMESGLTPEKMDRELRRIAFHLREEVRDATAKVLAKSDDVAQIESGLLAKINDMNRGELAAYVTHRKAILEILQRRLQLKDDGKYERERAIHELIFPLGKTSDDLYADDAHNLWILDERLNYHSYLASDIALNQTPDLAIESQREPDLLIFDQPVAMSPTAAGPSFVVIVEFKRPMRSTFDANAVDDENPIAQVNGYAQDLRDGKKLDRNGRPVGNLEGVPIYCFVVADLTPRLCKLIENSGNLHPTPGRQGYFGFNTNRQTYIEVISYDKLLNDATQRNRAFFDKLGLGLSPRST